MDALHMHYSAWESIYWRCLLSSVALRACLQEAMPKDPTSIQSLGCAHKEGYHKVRMPASIPSCVRFRCSVELLRTPWCSDS